MDIGKIGAEAILAVPADEPERLFGPDPKAVADLYRALAKRWHPDTGKGGNAAVLAHVSELKAAAEKRIAQGEWRKPGVARFEAVDGREYEIRHARRHDFELGEIYVGRTALAYALKSEFADLFETGERAMGKIAFLGDEMREIYEGRLPRILAAFATADRRVVVFAKTPDQILLRDLLVHCGGKLDPRHVAWIVSDLEGIACYLGLPFVGLVHPAVGPDTLLVSPRFHSVTLAGGWWYAAPVGEKLAAAPGRAVAHIPRAILSADRASPRATLEMVRLTACESLGHPSPIAVRNDKNIPQPFARWLLEPPADDAISDYQSWIAARDNSFGPRKFIELAVDTEAVYRPI